MKSLFLLLCTACLLTTGFSQPAGGCKIKLYAYTAECLHATTDDLLDFDGKGNEIFFTYYYSVATSNGTTRYINKVTTKVYGDTRNFPGRIKAGSGSSTGGIVNGDLIPFNPNTTAYMPIGDPRFKGEPMVDADLQPGDFITFIPMLWEWDNGNNSAQQRIENFLINSFPAINFATAPNVAKAQFDSYGNNTAYASGFDEQGFRNALNNVQNTTATRPVGIDHNGNMSVDLWVLNKPIMEHKSKDGSYFNFRTNMFTSEAAEFANGWGKQDAFTCSLYFESLNGAVVPENRPIKLNPGNRPLNVDLNALSFYGRYTGTLDHGDPNQSMYYSINFKDATSLEVLAQNDFVLARGTYTKTNNQISGSFTYTTGEAFNFTGTVNGGNFTGTWSRNGGSNGSIPNSGNLVLRKQ